jgi:hypothetical protein
VTIPLTYHDSNGGATVPETYTSGMWLAKSDDVDEFVAAWRDFASWAHTWPAAGRYGSCATWISRRGT